ncbi:MAG: general secretion pathway protein GspC [Myxococcales bacterium]|nr:general secretion pathway protein GspC [Myxococcales bacterium]
MPIDRILKKNFWLVVLPLVGIAATLNAQAIAQFVGIGLAPSDQALSAPPPVGRVPPSLAGSARSTSADPILARNPFDSVTGPLHAPVEEPAADGTSAPGPVDTSDPWNAPPCDGVKVLIIAAARDENWSLASLQVSGDTKTVLRRRGGEVGGKTVHYVGWDRVWLNSGGTLCQASLFDKKEVAAAKPAPSPTPNIAPTPRRGAPALDESIKKGIVKVSATEFNIDRGVVDKILENQADLMRQARIVPEQENGKVVGIRMFGVRPDTLLGTLGMENGDRLQTINGFDMASPEKALEAYARLRQADKLTVQVNRRGQNINLDYNIK